MYQCKGMQRMGCLNFLWQCLLLILLYNWYVVDRQLHCTFCYAMFEKILHEKINEFSLNVHIWKSWKLIAFYYPMQYVCRMDIEVNAACFLYVLTLSDCECRLFHGFRREVWGSDGPQRQIGGGLGTPREARETWITARFGLLEKISPIMPCK